MPVPRFVVWMFLVGIMGLDAKAVSGQNYPNKPIRIVTAGVGGSNDFTSRLIAQRLAGPLGQQVIVDNRPSGVIPGQIVAQAPPDGYTLLLATDNLWRTSLLQDVPYDPVRDFSPITLVAIVPNVLVVHPSLPVRSVRELIALAKARPGELNYASGASGGSPHLAAELFKIMASVNLVRIPYKSGALQMADLVGGQVQLMFAIAPTSMPYVKSGRLRALAVTSAEPSASLPGLPTVAASGLAGYELVTIQCMFAPAKTPATVINRLNQEIVRVLGRADVKEMLFNAGAETVSSSPEQLAAAMKSDTARLSKMVKDAGIRGD